MHEILTEGRRHSVKDVLQIHPTVFGLNLSNNISVPQVRVNIMEIERDTSFEIPLLLTFRIYKSFYNFMEWSRLNLQVKIYRVQVTGKCIYDKRNSSPTLTPI